MVQCSTSESPDSGGKYINSACAVHAIVESAEYKPDESCVDVKCSVLRSTPAGQEDKDWEERFYLGEKAVKRFIRFAIAAGICTREQWDAAHNAGQSLDIDESRLPYQQFKAKFSMNPEYKCTHKKDGVKCGRVWKDNETECPDCGGNRRSWPETGFDFFRLDEEPEILLSQDAGGSSQPAQQPSQQATQQPETVAAAVDESGQTGFDDF